MTTNTAEWLLEIGGLTVGCRDGATDVAAQGTALAGQLRAAAGAWRAVSDCDLQGCASGCPLAALDGGQSACRLAHLLAPPDAVADEPSAERAAARYLQALQAAIPAVFHCRRHAHPAGECWFSGRFAEGAVEVCGDVLAVAHRVGH